MSRRQHLSLRIFALTLLLTAAVWPRAHGHAAPPRPAPPLVLAER